MSNVDLSKFLSDLKNRAKEKYSGAFNVFSFLAVLYESYLTGYEGCPEEEKAELKSVAEQFSFNFSPYAAGKITEAAKRISDVDMDANIYIQSRLFYAKMDAEKCMAESVTAGALLRSILNEPERSLLAVIAQAKGTDGGENFNKNFEEYEDRDIKESGTNPAKFISGLTAGTEKIRHSLLKSVFGQDNAVNLFISGYFRSVIKKAEEPEAKKPEATFLFAGPPGVGKTFLAEKIAGALKLPYRRFDMSEYSSREDSVYEFIGSDGVYKSSQPGNVTSFVKDNSRCVILFDEIEKASPAVINLFLQMLDCGRLRDKHTDEEVSFSDAVIILTTNAGRALYENSESSDFSDIPREVVLNALAEDINPMTKEPFFPAAICSRFASGNVVMFNAMSAQNLFKISQRKMEENTLKFENRFGIKTHVDPMLYSAVLLAEGGKADGRTVAGRTRSFFMNEVLEFSRLVKNGIEKIKDIEIKVDLSSCDDEIKKLFIPSEDYGILVFGGSPAARSFENISGVNIFEARDTETAKSILKKEKISFIAADIYFGLAGGCRKCLSIEDESTDSKKLFNYIRKTNPDMPFYLFSCDKNTLSEEERTAILSKGVQGILYTESSSFEEDIHSVCRALYQQESLDTLAKSNKLISFETSQFVSDDGKTGEIRVYDFGLISAVKAGDKSDILSSLSIPDVKFSDVIGAEDAKKELGCFVSYLKDPAKYVSAGISAPRGIIFYGPPGTGKTMLAKALASEAGVTFIATEGNSFYKKYAGEGTKRVHDIFRIARKYAPSVIFIDEIDAIGRERKGDDSGDGGRSGILTAFLTEMDGFKNDSAKPVFVLAATNFDVEPGKPKSLDPALMRRFDRRIYIDLPTREERIKFLNIRFGSNPIFDISDKMIENIAVRSTGMSIADLSSFVELAMRSIVIDGHYRVDDAVLEEAFETFNSGEKKTWNKDVVRRVARHEAGHTYISWKSGGKPSYVTVVSRAGHGGYMQHNDNEDKPIYTKDEILARIRTSLGGRAAEIVYYGKNDGISTGASGDLSNATRLAYNLLCSYGMSEDFGLAAADAGHADIFINSEIRKEINGILSSEMQKAVDIIEKGKKSVDALVNALSVKNHLSGLEIDAILSEAEKYN